MDYISTAQAAQKWGISANRVFKLIQSGRIPEAIKTGSMWMIPKTTEKPIDGRTRAGRANRMTYAAKTEEAITDSSFRYLAFEHCDPASFNPALTPEELQIKAILEAFHACHFEEADKLLTKLPKQISNRYCRISALYQACMLDIVFGRVVSFANHYDSLFTETQKDFPHNREMQEYVHLINATLGNEEYYLHSFQVDPSYCYHEDFLPRLAILSALSLTFAQNSPTIAELNAHELNCKLLKKSCAYGDLQTMHLYLGTGYAFMEDFEHAKSHFASALNLAEKHELYYNVVTHYLYWSEFMDAALLECAQETRSRVIMLSTEMQSYYLRFMKKASLNSVYTLLQKGDYALLYYAVQKYTNKEVAKFLHISPSTVSKKYSKMYTVFGVSGKKQLADFYQSFLTGSNLDVSHLASKK